MSPCEARELFEEQRERVMEVFTKWRAPLGLKWWTIDLSWEHDQSLFAEDEDGWRCISFVKCRWPYRTATIYINMHMLEGLSDDDLERHILHEMVHIPLFELEPKQKDFVEHRERVVCTLAQAFGWVREEGFEEGRKAGLKEARKK